MLTGIIAGLCAQGIEAEAAAACGVYLHGLAGELAADGCIALLPVNWRPLCRKHAVWRKTAKFK